MLEMEIIKPNILEMELLGQAPSTIGGTTNYNELSGKPKINGVELIGNKTTEDLGIEAGKEVYIGSEEPTDEDVVIWVDPSEEADKIPTKTSELENDSGFVNEEYVNNKIAEAELGSGDIDLSEYAKKIEVPTKVSQLENDSGFIKSIPSEYVTETELNNKGYLTEHQDLSSYAKKTDIPDVSNFAKKSDIPSINGLATEEYVNTAIQNALEVVENGAY